MTFNDYLNLDAKTASIEQLRVAVVNLKAAASKSLKAFERHGESVGGKIEQLKRALDRGDAPNKAVFKQTRAELQRTYLTYRAGLGTRQAKDAPYTRAKTSTYSGYIEAEKKREKYITQKYRGYSDLSRDDRKKFWQLYRELEESNPGIIATYGSDGVADVIVDFFGDREELDADSMLNAMDAYISSDRSSEAYRISLNQAARGRDSFDITRIIHQYKNSELSQVGNSDFFENYEGSVDEIGEALLRYYM